MSEAPRLWRGLAFATPAGPVVLPALWGRTTDLVVHLIEWVQHRVRKIAPDERWLRERYMHRSVLEVLAEGTTFCWAPCPERTFVASAVLNQHEVPHRLVLHERQVPGAGPPSTHMAVELDIARQTYWFDFSRWESKFCTGPYAFRADIERTIRVQRIELPFGPELLGVRPDDLVHLVEPGESDPEAKIDWFVGDLAHMDPRVLEERLIFSNAASRYELPPARAWAGDREAPR
ncbi:hypothetical protein [Streptomyces sp. NPDC046939]|uniref:hypothetical protein n=1 Tax=Streptomyces sp. NPDC046939 TaxID=3155376 RepID=UPI00340725D2